MERVLVVGMSGSGKTTAARRVAERLAAPFHELDALALGPGWSTRPDFVQRVEEITAERRWVFDSWGYPQVRQLLWHSADTVIWLDYPRRVVLPRLIRRSVSRSWTGNPVYGDNVETWRSWVSRSHPVMHAVSTFDERRRVIRALAQEFGNVQLMRFTGPREFEQWLVEHSNSWLAN